MQTWVCPSPFGFNGEGRPTCAGAVPTDISEIQAGNVSGNIASCDIPFINGATVLCTGVGTNFVIGDPDNGQFTVECSSPQSGAVCAAGFASPTIASVIPGGGGGPDPDPQDSDVVKSLDGLGVAFLSVAVFTLLVKGFQTGLAR